MTQKWLMPYKANRRNYEDVGMLPFALEHDRGFAGDKLYRIVKQTEGGFVRILNLRSDSREQLGPYYHRRDVMKDLRRVAAELERQDNAGVYDALNHAV